MDEISYSVRPSAAARETTYVLAPDRLVWRDGRNSEQSLAYADISSIQLISYAAFGGTAWQCTVKGKGGARLRIRSHHFAGLGRLESRVAGYAPFVRALTSRVARSSRSARFIAGSTGLWLTWLIIGVAAAIVLVLLAVALAGGADIGSAGIPAVAILIAAIPIGIREMRKGRSRAFDPGNPPAELTGGVP